MLLYIQNDTDLEAMITDALEVMITDADYAILQDDADIETNNTDAD